MSDKKRKADAQGDVDVFPIFKKKVKQSEEADSPASSSSVAAGNVPSQSSRVPLKIHEFFLLLDFSTVTEDHIQGRLNSIAESLLSDFVFAARRTDGHETEYRVLEAEFYLQIEGCHEDPFTHGSEEQKIGGRWYFHRAPRRSEDSHRSATSLTAYRSGSRKGMDLTFGAPLPPALEKELLSISSQDGSALATPIPRQLQRGGILIRTLHRLAAGKNTAKVISGPSLLVDEILSASGASGIEDLVEEKWERNTSAFLSAEGSPPACLYLKAAPSPKAPSIYYSPRIGLDLSHPGTTSPSVRPLHPRIQFLRRRYRFFTRPDLLTANGRAQTFLGTLQTILEARPDPDLSRLSLPGDVSRVSGIQGKTSTNYFFEYKAGRKAGAAFLDQVIGSKGKGASSSPATYLKMMGALSTL